MYLVPQIVIVALAALSSLAEARIVGVSVPDTALVGSTINATLHTEGYIQNWDDFGAVWGLVPSGQNVGDGVGEMVGYQNIYGDPDYPPGIGNITYPVTLPNVSVGTYTLRAAVPHLVGASGGTSVNFFSQNITLVDNVKRRRASELRP